MKKLLTFFFLVILIVVVGCSSKDFLLKFDNNGHGQPLEDIKEIKNLPDPLPTVTEEGYSFAGWYIDSDFNTLAVAGAQMKGNMVLYAKWIEVFTLSFDMNHHGTQISPISNVWQIPNDLPNPKEEGYSFAGWFFDQEFLQEVHGSEPILKDTTIYAKWDWIDPNSYLDGYSSIQGLSVEVKNNISVDGYAQDGISDFTQYLNTDAYRKVSTPLEFLTALVDAKYDYENHWDEETQSLTQILNKEGKVHVIEITKDLNLGYFRLGTQEKATNLVSDFASNLKKWESNLCISDMVRENGISQIKIENTSNLLIYSKNGAKLTHCGFKLTSDTNVVFRNLAFDELWQWEDAPVNSTAKIGDYDWFGWAYFKISFCGFIWIDHCSFGKSYDGQIDYANPVYNANAGTAFRAPYGATGENGLHISWCNFHAGSDDKTGYLYQMMMQIEKAYQNGEKNYLYYNSLRDANISFEDILYGLAIPQKKGFLCGDDAKFSGSYESKDDYNFNLKLRVSFSNCTFLNLEDRLPKLRGGNAYLYNCLVDSSMYYAYRTKLIAANAKGVVTKINSGWKCALVSQGIVCGNGGSVQAENTIFKGIDTLIKHNDTKNVSPYVDGGFSIVNCRYQRGANSMIYNGSSSDLNTIFISSIPAKLNTKNFSWKTPGEIPPFVISSVDLDKLENHLSHEVYGCGTTLHFQQMFLISQY